MRLKGRFLFLSITDENGQYKMAADEKSTLKLFFDCRFHSPHSGTNTKINIKYTFLVRFHIFSRNDRLFIDNCDVIARANMENCYQNSNWGKGLIKSRNNESYTFHL